MTMKTKYRPHDLRFFVKDETYIKMWEMKDFYGKPFCFIIEKAIDELFEKEGLIYDETFKKTWKSTK